MGALRSNPFLWTTAPVHKAASHPDQRAGCLGRRKGAPRPYGSGLRPPLPPTGGSRTGAGCGKRPGVWRRTWGSVTASSSNRPEGAGTPWTPGLGLTFVLVVQERTGSDRDAREVRDQARRETVQRYHGLTNASGRPVPQWAGLAESAGADPARAGQSVRTRPSSTAACARRSAMSSSTKLTSSHPTALKGCWMRSMTTRRSGSSAR